MRFTRSPLLRLMLLCVGSVLLSQAAVWVAEQPSARARQLTGGRGGPAPDAKHARPPGPATAPPAMGVTAVAGNRR